MKIKEKEEETVDVYQLADLNNTRIKFAHSVLNSFSVIEDYSLGTQGHLQPNSRRDFMSIFVVTKGEGKVNLNMEELVIKENSLIHIAPNTLIDSSEGAHGCTISGVSFSSDFLKEIGMPERFSEIFNYFSSKFYPVWDLEPEDTALIKHQIHLLVQRIKKFAVHPFGKEILVHGFYIFLFEVGALGQKYSQMTRLNFSRKESLVIKFSNLAQQQFREIRTVKKYADQLNVSAKYLTEIVKEYSGKNASEIINDLVILEAKFLLSKSQLSIGEIADVLHFSDQSFFGKYFKRQTGVSPKSYRESEFIN